MRPMLVNETFVLTNARTARNRGPTGHMCIVKADVDVRVLLNLGELVRGVLGYEEEIDLGGT